VSVCAVAIAVRLRGTNAPLPPPPSSLHLLDRDGNPLRVVLARGDVRCDPVALEGTGDWTARALVAAEDKRFFSHPGVDVLAVGRALVQNASCGRTISGASTLSTQLVRLVTPRPRTLRTKILEALGAMRL
jgi:penicillin-binding protein 1C